MLDSQRLQVRMSEVRESINGLPDDVSNEDRDKLTADYSRLESEYRAALVTEDTRDVESTAEGRELRHLVQRASIVDYIIESAAHTPVAGAAKELRQAVFGSDMVGYMPLQMLVEHRADAVTNVAAAIDVEQMPIAARVFPRSSVNYLGISTPSVSPGTKAYPRITGGTSADVRNDGVELDGTAAIVDEESFNPVRLTASYTYGRESLSRVSGLEEALRRDVNAVLEDKRDKLAINGRSDDTDGPAVEGVISGLTDPTDPTAVANWETYLAAFTGMVDGIHAISDEEVRLLVNVATWKHAQGLQIETSGELVKREIPAARFRASANMPANATGNIATAIGYAMGSEAVGFLMPTWKGVEVVNDPYSLAKKGQHIATLIMVMGWGFADSSAYKRIEFKTAAA